MRLIGAPMEESFETEYTRQFDRFIRDYLILRTGQLPKIDKVYESFKRYVLNTEQQEAIEAIIKKIVHYSKHYVRIALPEQEDRPRTSRLP